MLLYYITCNTYIAQHDSLGKADAVLYAITKRLLTLITVNCLKQITDAKIVKYDKRGLILFGSYGRGIVVFLLHDGHGVWILADALCPLGGALATIEKAEGCAIGNLRWRDEDNYTGIAIYNSWTETFCFAQF